MATYIQTEIPHSACPTRLLRLPARPRILVVDDSPDLIDLVCLVLQAHYEVEIIGRATDGSQAVELVSELQPDLVIMDVCMPQLDGLTAAAIISSRYPATSVVLMSGDDSPQLCAQARKSGAKTFIHKPRLSTDIAAVLGEDQRNFSASQQNA